MQTQLSGCDTQYLKVNKSTLCNHLQLPHVGAMLATVKPVHSALVKFEIVKEMAQNFMHFVN